jgi:hypothetical protein
MASSDFSTPMLLDDGRATTLERLRAHDIEKDEDWLQDLLFRNPALLPAAEIDVS